MEVERLEKKNRLCIIELDSTDRVKGNYELVISGPVKHIPNHKYLVSQEQIENLKQKGIKFSIVKSC